MAGRKHFRENGCRVYAQYTGREYETEPPQDSNDVYDRYHSWISDDFPVPLAMSCSFNPELVEKSAAVSAKEGSAAGYQVTFSPMVDVVRDPRWGRVMESFGEDKRLNADFGSAMVRGYQGEDLKHPESMAACVKHFAAYGAVQGGRDYNTADVSEYSLRNQYLPPFKACIDAGTKLVMAAFQALNGVPANCEQMAFK